MQVINQNYLERLKPHYINKGYSVPKWIIFCEAMFKLSYTIKLHRAKTTVSKYLYLSKNESVFKIRFSNHKANRDKEFNDDCDYYVGVGNKSVLTTEKLIDIIRNKDNQ